MNRKAGILLEFKERKGIFQMLTHKKTNISNIEDVDSKKKIIQTLNCKQ